MMDKPIPKREVAVYTVIQAVRQINFHATNDAVTEFDEFGTRVDAGGILGGYSLYVDSRYDFDEVLAFIEGYG
jgi:hypothetical protein